MVRGRNRERIYLSGGGPAALRAAAGAVPAARWGEPGPGPSPPAAEPLLLPPPPCPPPAAPRNRGLPEAGRAAPQEAETGKRALRRRPPTED